MDNLANEVHKIVVKELNNLEIYRRGDKYKLRNKSVVARKIAKSINQLYHDRINIKMIREDGFIEDRYGIKGSK